MRIERDSFVREPQGLVVKAILRVQSGEQLTRHQSNPVAMQALCKPISPQSLHGGVDFSVDEVMQIAAIPEHAHEIGRVVTHARRCLLILRRSPLDLALQRSHHDPRKLQPALQSFTVGRAERRHPARSRVVRGGHVSRILVCIRQHRIEMGPARAVDGSQGLLGQFDFDECDRQFRVTGYLLFERGIPSKHF